MTVITGLKYEKNWENFTEILIDPGYPAEERSYLNIFEFYGYF